MSFIKNVAIALSAIAITAGSAVAAPVAVDLNTWQENSIGQARWTVSGDGASVVQSLNGQPTVFFNPGNSQGTALSGTITVNASDDDFIGFVLGYEDGDMNISNPNFVLIDWKGGDQSGTSEGLAASRVVGNISATDIFSSTSRAATLVDLGRATNLGETGWVRGQTYNFDLVFTPSNIQVFVDGILELNIFGAFDDGGFGFYNNSQSGVTYGTITEQDVVVPVPAAAVLLAPALLLLRKRRAAKKAA